MIETMHLIPDKSLKTKALFQELFNVKMSRYIKDFDSIPILHWAFGVCVCGGGG